MGVLISSPIGAAGDESSEGYHSERSYGTVLGGNRRDAQIDSLYRRAALRHRIISRSFTGTSAKLVSIMRIESG